MRLILLASLISCSLQAPTVTFSSGTVVGNQFVDVESFKGIPFAQPPVGNRRLRPPSPLAAPFGTISATADGPPCPTLSQKPNLPSTVSAALASTTPSSANFFPPSPQVNAGPGGPEDCLYLNVQRPVGTTSGSKLPVLLWIYGGGFVGGSTILYDGSQLLSKARSLSQPFIYVTFNYRLAAFGWLPGKELSDEGSTNLGLRDQRLAMQWVQDNIAAFGGDPARVTIAGESAGSFSAFAQLQVEGGNNLYKGKPLFTGAIMDSGNSLPALPVRHPRPQALFDKLAQSAGCGAAANKLQCLRGVSYETFFKAQNDASPSFFESGLAYPPRPDPASTFFSASSEISAANGVFAKVPMIIGAQADEGTLFVLTAGQYASSTEGIVNFLMAQAPLASRENATKFVQYYPGTYPQSVTEGSPFGTGYANELYPGFKRFAALYGDLSISLARRISLDYMATKTKIWSYISTYEQNLPFLGTTHGTDVLCTFFGIGPASAVGETQFRYLSFVLYGDPNTLGVKTSGSGYLQWPQYSLSTRQLLNFGAFGPYYTTDNFRQQSFEYLKSIYSTVAI